jgi:diaminopropionate ammonia-lyase
MLTDFFHNTHVVTTLEDAIPDRTALEFHRKLPGYAPTPLFDMPAMAAKFRVGRIWIKQESSRMNLPAFKILGASWATYQALRERLGHDFAPWATLNELAAQLEPLRPLTLATATDGNHGRAVARMAALLGLDAHIFMPAGTVEARIQAIQSEGAMVTVVDGSYDDAVQQAAALAGKHCAVISDTSWPGYETIPRRVIEGYATIFWEVTDELQRQGQTEPDVVLVQSGVGALAAAAVRHYRRPTINMHPVLINVEPTSAACVLASARMGKIVSLPHTHDSIMAGLNCGTPSLVAWPLLQQGFDAFLAIDDEQTRRAMRDLANQGIVAGETGAAGLAGFTALLTGAGAHERRELLCIRKTAQVLIILTEGATDPAAYARIIGMDVEQVGT